MRLLTCLVLAAGVTWAGPFEGPTTAEVCGGCHRSIYDAWVISSHAHAMDSRLFQDVLEMAETDVGASARRVCLSCHAPTAGASNDLALVKKVSWEGVTCDFCHSIKGVAMTGQNPKPTVAYGAIKTGPLKDAESNIHATEYSAVHTSSDLCASCHEYKNSLGFPVLTTYSEWKASQYAKDGRECQSCHMSVVTGDVVDPRVKRTGQVKVNLHQMPGSHSLDQLTKAVRAQLTTERVGGELRVNIDVINQMAGHSLPTGSPLRRLVMEVRADSYGGAHLRQERVYARSVADQQGAPVEKEYVAFLKGAKVISDTRLGAGEKRAEKFTFAIPAGQQVQVTATFWYYFSPLARTESQKRVTFLTLNRLVR